MYYILQLLIIPMPVVMTLTGIFVRVSFIRWIVWLAALPLAAFGLVVLGQGGIVEQFTGSQKVICFLVTNSPVIGCAVGEYLKANRKRK